LKKKSLNSVELLDYQPNRYPFLMIDYVTEVVPGKLQMDIKILQIMSGFFQFIFLGRPNVPGALQLEALAQMLTVAITTLTWK
jgi:3-hydroxyacyl-[acyl-carrier-protein] dehydratase